MSRLISAALAGALALTTAGALTLGRVVSRDSVTFVLDGVAKQEKVRQGTVAQALEAQNIRVGSRDSVRPSPGTRTHDGARITVDFGKKLTITLDGTTVTRWTTARTVDAALSGLRLDNPKNYVSVSRLTAIPRKGLSFDVRTAKNVTVTAKGQKHAVTAIGTVSDALDQAGVRHDSDDEIRPAADTPLTQGMAITWVQIDRKKVNRRVDVAHGTRTVKDPSMATGDTKVVTRGVDGENLETWTMTYRDGTLDSKRRTAVEQVRAPITQVTKVGTKASSPTSAGGSGSQHGGPGQPAKPPTQQPPTDQKPSPSPTSSAPSWPWPWLPHR